MVTKNRSDLPPEIKLPNNETQAAMKEAVTGENVEEWDSVDSFIQGIQTHGAGQNKKVK